jgi:DNA-binding transcriptional ArsR family regulator
MLLAWYWEQAVASQHLRILRKTRFVNTKRDGREIYYPINHERFAGFDKLIKKMLF